MSPRILATDLDGTLIPLDDHPQNVDDLQTLETKLREKGATLIFVTGRHLESIRDKMLEHSLPAPEWIIGDVGTSIYRRAEDQQYEPVEEYLNHQAEITSAYPVEALRRALEGIEGLELQEEEKQGRFKLSYYTDPEHLDPLADRLRDFIESNSAPWSLIASVDPFTRGGLLDLLPQSISKAYALDWWHQYQGRDRDETLFAGDSGNDLAALTAGYRSIIVGNANRKLVDEVQAEHNRAGWSDRLHKAEQVATSGVLEGCRRFGLIDE